MYIENDGGNAFSIVTEIEENGEQEKRDSLVLHFYSFFYNSIPFNSINTSTSMYYATYYVISTIFVMLISHCIVIMTKNKHIYDM